MAEKKLMKYNFLLEEILSREKENIFVDENFIFENSEGEPDAQAKLKGVSLKKFKDKILNSIKKIRNLYSNIKKKKSVKGKIDGVMGIFNELNKTINTLKET